jgi:hypothetical protein
LTKIAGLNRIWPPAKNAARCMNYRLSSSLSVTVLP